jgi:hypothetical protein
MHFQLKVSLVYCIARRMKRDMTYSKALEIANHFSEQELQRIYNAVRS